MSDDAKLEAYLRVLFAFLVLAVVALGYVVLSLLKLVWQHPLF